jgi:glycerol uptake facilitator-like aquaporin
MTATAAWRRFVAEFVGTALLVTAVVGSGVMATTLSADDAGLQLLENSVATAFALGTLILMFGPVSGAHSTRWCRSPIGTSAGEKAAEKPG